MENPDDRVTLAASTMVALALEFPDSVVNLNQTPSGSPVVEVAMGERTYLLTVTIARKADQP